MRKLNFLATVLFTTLLFVSCSKDDDSTENKNEFEKLSQNKISVELENKELDVKKDKNLSENDDSKEQIELKGDILDFLELVKTLSYD